MKKLEQLYDEMCKSHISEMIKKIKFKRHDIEYLNKQTKHLRVIEFKTKQSIDLDIKYINEYAKEHNLTDFLLLCMNGNPKPPSPPKARKIGKYNGLTIKRKFPFIYKKLNT